MAIGTNMIKVSCSFCGRKPDNERLDSDFWPLYARNIDSYSNVCICNACKIRHPNAFDFYFSEKEKEPMKVKVRRDSKEEIEVDVNDLQYNDEFDISKGGEVIANGTIVDIWVDRYGVQRADVTIAFKKEGKTWRDLGYDCFEDMIDDIAKRHGSTGHKYAGEWVDEIYPGAFDGHLIADSYRDCIISIYDTKTDKHAIINASCATVYIPDKAKCFNKPKEAEDKAGSYSPLYEKIDAMNAIYGLDKRQAAEFVALLSAEVGSYGRIDKIGILNSLKKVRGRGLYD